MFIKPPGADEAAEEGYRIFRDEVNDLPGLALSLMNMARIAQDNGDAAEMRMYDAKLKELIQQSPASLMAGMFYFSSAMREKTHANYAAAKAYLEDSLIVFNQIRNKNFLISVQTEFGHIARYTGRMDEAKAIYRKALKDWQDYGNRGAVANLFECYALIAVAEEEPKRAAILLGAAEALREKAQSPMTDWERIEYDQCMAQLRTLFSEAEFDALWAEGRSMTMEQAVQFALDSR
jgi:tetratricopeptide (TPR) repeat protein